MVLHPLMTVMSTEAFYQAKEAYMKLTKIPWKPREAREGLELYIPLKVDDAESFVNYFKAIGFEVKFLPNNNPDYVVNARFIPILDKNR